MIASPSETGLQKTRLRSLVIVTSRISLIAKRST